MTQPYMKPGLQWEDPLDGKGPRKHRAHKKGARQTMAGSDIVCRCGLRLLDDCECDELDGSFPATTMREEPTK